MNWFKKILKADPERKTRLHDLRGNFVGLRAIAAAPRWMWDWACAKRGIYSTLPWIPPSARERLQSLVRPDWTVLECGAGMSTLWWTQRVAQVVSFESNREWHDTLLVRAERERVQNLDLIFASNYHTLLPIHIARADLVVIDGDLRDLCAKRVVASASRPMWVYLDNTDFAALQREMQDAEKMLLAASDPSIAPEYFLGVPPGQLAPTQGLLLQIVPRTGTC